MSQMFWPLSPPPPLRRERRTFTLCDETGESRHVPHFLFPPAFHSDVMEFRVMKVGEVREGGKGRLGVVVWKWHGGGRRMWGGDIAERNFASFLSPGYAIKSWWVVSFFPAALDDLKEITEEEEEEEEGERKRAEDEGVRWDLFLHLALALLLLFSDTPAGATLVFFSDGPAPLALAMAFSFRS